MSIDLADEATVSSDCLRFVGEISRENGCLVFDSFGGGNFVAKTITDGIDIFGGSLERTIDDDAGTFIFDAGIFETII